MKSLSSWQGLDEENDGVLICLQTETCYLFYGPKNSTLSPHLHGALVRRGQKLKEDIVGRPLCFFNPQNDFILLSKLEEKKW